MNLLIKWFLSKTVRHAVEMRKTVLKLIRAQQDLIKPESADHLRLAAESLRNVALTADKNELKKEMKRLEEMANKHLVPYPTPTARENTEVVLVAIAVAMAIRTFYLQPFKIPTGSMRPTLYGITEENFRNQEDVKFPTGIEKTFDSWFRGITHVHVVAKESGYVNRVGGLKRHWLFSKKQSFYVGDVAYTVPWIQDELITDPRVDRKIGRSGLQWSRDAGQGNQYFEKGEDIMKLKIISGDHLFVDRMTYNFRQPRRGEIIVFATKGISSLPQDQFYIKRLVGMGGEKVSLNSDRAAVIDGEPLSAATYRFENVYTFDVNEPPRDNEWSGHVNGTFSSHVARLFPDPESERQIRPNHYMVFGDNTLNSSDSRTWGDFSQTNVIGRSAFVYWPIFSQGDRPSRFGWSHR
jgi:signal peptidase I